MKNLVVLFFTLLLYNAVSAQGSKLGIHMEYFHTGLGEAQIDVADYMMVTNPNLSSTQVGISYTRSNDKWEHSFQLFFPTFNIDKSGKTLVVGRAELSGIIAGEQELLHASANYVLMRTARIGRSVLGFGGILSPMFSEYRFIPVVSNGFPLNYNRFRTWLTCRLSYEYIISDNFSMSMYGNFNILTFDAINYTVQDPNLPLNKQSNQQRNLDTGPLAPYVGIALFYRLPTQIEAGARKD